jgi:hypothetical protein
MSSMASSLHKRAIPAANALKYLLERIPGGDGIQQLHALIAAEGDEVQAVLAVISNWLDVHSCRL